jgi:hypothetical protein
MVIDNKECTMIEGYTHEIMGQNPFDFVHAGDHKAIKNLVTNKTREFVTSVANRFKRSEKRPARPWPQTRRCSEQEKAQLGSAEVTGLLYEGRKKRANTSLQERIARFFGRLFS